jgi:RimJ/RimL family protein N-acetyltransferase
MIPAHEDLRSHAYAGAEPEPREPLRGRWTASRPLEPDDLPFLYRLVIDPTIGTALRYQGATPGYDDFARHAWDGVLGQWIVTTSGTGEPLGVVVVTSPDFRNGYAYLSVIAHPRVLGSGIMMDGVASVLEHVFACWPFRQLYFESTDDNYGQFASGLGRFFVEEGCRRAQCFSGNRYHDVHLLTLTRTAWECEGAPLWQRLCARTAPVT